jgi:hypothetical protein
MKKLTLAASLVLAPAIVQAQAGVQVQSQTQASVTAAAAAKTTKAEGGAGTNSSTSASAQGEQRLSADAQSKVDANLRVAREKKLPEEPIRRRVAEGQAKGASEAQIVAASGRTVVELQSSFDAMARGGHATPSDEEIARGAQLMARGYTSAQLEGIARKAPSDRSLVVAFETLTSLQAQGTPTSQAVTRLEGLLAGNASDAQLRGATGSAAAAVTGGLNVGDGVGSTTGSAAGNASGSAAGAGSAGAAAGSVAGSAAAGAGAAATGALGGVKGSATSGVTGRVGGVIGKP